MCVYTVHGLLFLPVRLEDFKVKEMTDKETRSERYDRQTNEQYAELGRFVQAFEEVVLWTRMTCLHLLPARNGKEQQLTNILLHHRAMTAAPLFECMRALYGETMKQEGEAIIPEEVKVINGVLKQSASDMELLVSRRNTLLHATWYIGYGNHETTDFSKITSHKGKPSKDGMNYSNAIKDLDELRDLTTQCGELRDVLSLLLAAFKVGLLKKNEGPRARYNFEKINGRWCKKKKQSKGDDG